MYRRTIEFIKNYEYPRLTAFAFSLILSGIMLSSDALHAWVRSLHELSYFGIFVAGFFSVFGFTAPLAVTFFLLVGSEVNIIAASIIGAIGALIADLLIFEFIKSALMAEIHSISKRAPLRWILELFSFLPYRFRKWFSIILGCAIIASPFPDEIGVALLAAFSKIHEKAFILISFALDFLGMLAIFYVAQYIAVT